MQTWASTLHFFLYRIITDNGVKLSTKVMHKVNRWWITFALFCGERAKKRQIFRLNGFFVDNFCA